MKLTKTKLQQMWRSERRNTAPSPERDHLMTISFKQWVRENGKRLANADDYSDEAMKLLGEFI
jgi:hypothetical protein